MSKLSTTKIVLTGGPCAGKTTLADLIARAFEHSVINVPEAASLLFSGGFPRFPEFEAKKSVQRAIFATQLELEAAYAAHFPGKALVLDRGTVDGAAYWPEGPESYFQTLGTTLSAELERYGCVIYLESAGQSDYLIHKSKNPNRKEDWEEAKSLDQETFRLWSQHPSFIHIHNNKSFAHKVSEVLGAVAQNLRLENEDEQ